MLITIRTDWFTLFLEVHLVSLVALTLVGLDTKTIHGAVGALRFTDMC